MNTRQLSTTRNLPPLRRPSPQAQIVYMHVERHITPAEFEAWWVVGASVVFATVITGFICVGPFVLLYLAAAKGL